ncbi:uncharacterized protein LOC124796742 isoform X2 [Schistocerca piceifrons]|uniref:uncharacterized protein LOC124796742 isoform X2 n=1 Tax=Schistocerca piceifrons TaxID=274613 RepID=UPI001F5EC64D|nr:uncharacterized protein LOC124796742 isoform X2 [Schistocerca piceifrons]
MVGSHFVHFDDNQFENHRADGYRRLKPTAVPTLFTLERGPTSYGRLQRTDNINNEPLCYEDSITIFESDDDHAEMVEQRMTFVQARIDEVRDTFRGRQTSTRGRRRGRPRKRPNDDLDEWTPDRPRAVRGRKRGRPPAGGGRGRQAASVSPVRKAPRGRGRVANERQRPGPKPKLEGPGPPPAVITPGGKCFVCSKAAGSTGSPLTAVTNTTKIQLHQKLGRVVGAELDLIVDEDGVLCHGCCRLLNYMDRIEVEHSMLTKSILNCMRRTFGFGYVQGDNRMPEAVLASIEDRSKNSIIPVEKHDPAIDVPEKDTSGDAALQNKTVAPSDSDDKKKNETLLVDRVPEKKTDAEQDKKNYHCKICNFESKHKSVFLFHLQRHIQSSYRCDFCNALLPKGFKILDSKNAETSNGEIANKNEVIPHTEAPEVQATKEVKDYVETMIEELHTTGIVTTMKPVTPEKFKSSSEIQIDNVHNKETVVASTLSETKDTSAIYEQQSGTSVEQGTLNILLTFPNERRQSISVHHDVPIENNFSNDVVARQLRDIFGNFNDEPMDVEDKTDTSEEKNVGSLNTAFVKTLADVPLLENSPLMVVSNNESHKQEQNEAGLKKLTTENPDSEICAEEMDVEPETSSCNEDTEEKYQKQLALLDEMGLIMLPKRIRPSASKQSAETVVKGSDDMVEDSRDRHWGDPCHTENTVEPSQEHEDQSTQENELQVLKEQSQWLPESLNPVETISTTTESVTVLMENDAQLQPVQTTENGNEWLKSNVTLVNENPLWLHQADNTSTTTDGSSEMTVWTNTASHSDPPETLTVAETERNWLLPENQISEPVCTNVKETEIEGVDTIRDTHVWDPAQNGNTDSGGDISRKSDELGGNMNSDSPASNNGEGVTSTTTVPESEVTNSNMLLIEVENEERAENSLSNKQCVKVDKEDLKDNVKSLHSDPAEQNTVEEPSSPMQDVVDEVITHSVETVIVGSTHQTELSAQEHLSTVFVTDNVHLETATSGQAVSPNKQEDTDDTASADSCDVKQFDFRTSERDLCNEGGNSVETEEVMSSISIKEDDDHSSQVKELEDTGSISSVVPQSELKVYSDKSDIIMTLVEGQSDVNESSTESNFESVKR